jgi:hypothetical protein
VVFLMERQLRVGYGVSIRHVNKSGSSAHGNSVLLPAIDKYPYEEDFSNTFKRLK